jgi:hypothetical protein
MGGTWRLAVVATVMFALTACAGGGGDGDQVASLNGDPNTNSPAQNADDKADEDKMREFTKCMREHGVEMPEPDAEGRIKVEAHSNADGSGNHEAMDKAHEACRTLLPNGGKPKPMSPEDLDKARQRAKCMRDHGVDMPDPDPNSPGITTRLGENVDKDKMEKAFKECGMGEAVGAAPAAPPAGGGGK